MHIYGVCCGKVEALHYKMESLGFDSQWCHWNCSLTTSDLPATGLRLQALHACCTLRSVKVRYNVHFLQ